MTGAAMEPFPLVDLAGAPFERGLSYGRAARERIERSVALYAGRLDRLGLSRAGLARLVAGIEPACAHFGPAAAEEMRGVAQGAGVAYEDVVLVNARTEIVAMAGREAARREAPDGCTGVVVLPFRSASGRTIHAQTWDWLAACAETAVVLRVAPEEGPRFLSFTEAGGLARSGLNEAGIAITANHLACDRDYRRTGVPLPLVRRAVLESGEAALAVRAITATPKSGSNNMMLSCAGGWAANFECAPDEAFPLAPDDGLLVHANHWIGRAALAKVVDTGLADSPDSLYRDWRTRERLKGLAAIALADARDALADDFGAPRSVCASPYRGPDGEEYATVATIVMDPERGAMEIAPMPALGGRFARYALDADPTELAA